VKKRKYVRRKITNELIVKEVTKIRRKNNSCWMNLLALAFKSKPRQAKKIMEAITENDRNVTKWMTRLK
jgi:hypothetical protein